MVNVYIKERINDQKTICVGGVTSNTTYLGFLECETSETGTSKYFECARETFGLGP